MKRLIYLLLIALEIVLLVVLQAVLFTSGYYEGNKENENVVLQAVIEETAVIYVEQTTVEPTQVVEVTPTATIVVTIEPTATPTAIPTTATPKPTVVKTAESQTTKPTAQPTPESTAVPSYTVISSSIRSGALQGINDGREEEGNPPASLSSTLNAKAEAHAIAMAKANSLYHSSMGYVESIRSGANIDGWSEGYAATCHATQLATKAEITQIGVGSAMSIDGTVYTCIIGAYN